jgi:uncharacterized tellurite resistance protein B-like protein
MHEQDIAIVKALIPVAWADDDYADAEREMIEALLDAYHASDAEKKALREFAATRRTLDDIDLQELSTEDRRVLFTHAVLLTFADGDQSADEVAFLKGLAAKLRIDEPEANGLMTAGAARAKKLLHLL